MHGCRTSAAIMATSSLQRKLRKAVEPQPDEPEVLEALRELSAFHSDNTLAARRSLRSTIEKRGLSIDTELLVAFEKLNVQLDAIDRDMEGLSGVCNSISSQLQHNRSSTEVMLSQTARLREQVQLTERKWAVADDFVRNYQLTPDEEAVLNAPQALELEPLLAALRRVQARPPARRPSRNRSDCRPHMD